MTSMAAKLTVLACAALACLAAAASAASSNLRSDARALSDFETTCAKWLDCSRSCPRRGCFPNRLEQCMEYMHGECGKCTDMGLCSTSKPTSSPTSSPTTTASPTPLPTASADAASCDMSCETECPTCFVDNECKEYHNLECAHCDDVPVCSGSPTYAPTDAPASESCDMSCETECPTCFVDNECKEYHNLECAHCDDVPVC